MKDSSEGLLSREPGKEMHQQWELSTQMTNDRWGAQPEGLRATKDHHLGQHTHSTGLARGNDSKPVRAEGICAPSAAHTHEAVTLK